MECLLNEYKKIVEGEKIDVSNCTDILKFSSNLVIEFHYIEEDEEYYVVLKLNNKKIKIIDGKDRVSFIDFRNFVSI